jgi:hypothetical protein
VCHDHLTSDLGEDLYKIPQEMLRKRLRAMKLQLHLKDQRSSQTQWLRKAIKEKDLPLILKELLNGKEIHTTSHDGLGREVLLALHAWMLDYANDGHCQGFPFDPYLLYFHRRIVKAYAAAEGLLSGEIARGKFPKAFTTFSSKLEKYLSDSLIIEAAELYEKAFDMFERIRSVLRLWAKGTHPMHDLYELDADEHHDVSESLTGLRNQFKESKRECTDSNERKLYDIVETHFERYEPYLFPVHPAETKSKRKIARTTNGLESHWSEGKRIRRQTHGRSRRTRDFKALPPEYMLIPTLHNPRYVEIVLGNLDRLPEKLAEAGETSGPYSTWYKRQQPLHIGRLPARLLRRENFLDNLIGIYNASDHP